MRREFDDRRLRFHIGDVRDPESVDHVMRGVDYVFHAAALKQVPSCEFFPLEAVRTNVLGSANIIHAAERYGVRSVVCLSTDKAVRPINAMGMSKAVMEKTAQAFARGRPDAEPVVSVVRYGNVMYSRGSVIPLFVEQVKAGRPLTLTDPSMTRFMMSLDDAVALVEHAFANARPGDLFVRKAPACTIEDLARAVCNLFGVEFAPVRIGTRHGEKTHETLASREELLRAEDTGTYFRIPVDARGLDYEVYFAQGEPSPSCLEDYTSANTRRLDIAQVEELLLTIPEFRAELRAAGALTPVDAGVT